MTMGENLYLHKSRTVRGRFPASMNSSCRLMSRKANVIGLTLDATILVTKVILKSNPFGRGKMFLRIHSPTRKYTIYNFVSQKRRLCLLTKFKQTCIELCAMVLHCWRQRRRRVWTILPIKAFLLPSEIYSFFQSQDLLHIIRNWNGLTLWNSSYILCAHWQLLDYIPTHHLLWLFSRLHSKMQAQDKMVLEWFGLNLPWWKVLGVMNGLEITLICNLFPLSLMLKTSRVGKKTLIRNTS